MAKAATVYDVARHAGVSIATVSMTFRRPDRVKESTREIVHASARALHYVPSASARGLADGRTGVLGLFSFDYLLRAETAAHYSAAARRRAGSGADIEGAGPDSTNGPGRGANGTGTDGPGTDGPGTDGPGTDGTGANGTGANGTGTGGRDPDGSGTGGRASDLRGAGTDGDGGPNRCGAVGGGAGAGNAGVRYVREGPNERCRDFPLYVDEIQRGMELACWQHGYALMIGGPSRSAAATTVTDIAGRVDGLAVFPQTLTTEALERIAGRIPVVAVSEPPQDDRLSHITVDNRGGMRACTEHLIRDHGRRDLLFVGGLNPAEARARFSGFKDALRAAGLRVPRKPLVPATRLTGTGRAAVQLPDDLPLPDAFVCATDDVALDVLDSLAARGVPVPDQVAVTGFDDVAAGRIVRPALTTVRQPMVEMGQMVVDVLRDRIADPSRAPEYLELPVQVVLRESCGCPPRGPIW